MRLVLRMNPKSQCLLFILPSCLDLSVIFFNDFSVFFNKMNIAHRKILVDLFISLSINLLIFNKLIDVTICLDRIQEPISSIDEILLISKFIHSFINSSIHQIVISSSHKFINLSIHQFINSSSS